MRSKNKPPKQNTLSNEEKEGMKNKPPKQNTLSNEEKEGMKEEREKSTEEEEKNTFEKKICREALFFFFWIANYFLKETKEWVCLPVLSGSGFGPIPFLGPVSRYPYHWL